MAYKCIYDPLSELMNYFSKNNDMLVEKSDTKKVKLSIEDKLKKRIIDGDKSGIDEDLNEALKKYTAIEIINSLLLEGMKTVGELFGSGQMQLPFVLKSAEFMKASVKYLEPYMEKNVNVSSKGTIILATVKGDVHDIGKNLVDIILTNNGYKVINLGIKCPIESMLNSYNENNADAIGMSGLLVKSTVIMKENLELMNERNLKIPVILGGAALTRRYVEGDLRNLYNGDVYYANDAFDGLKHMENISADNKSSLEEKKVQINFTKSQDKITSKESVQVNESDTKNFINPNVSKENDIPVPPFLGCRTVNDISPDEIYKYINEVALFRGSWNIYKGNKTQDEYDKLIKKEIRPKFNDIKEKAKIDKLINPILIYGYFPAVSEGNKLFILKPKLKNIELHNIWENINPIELNTNLTYKDFEEYVTFDFPRQNKGKFLCISDYIKSKESKMLDIVPFIIVTVGKNATEYTKKLYDNNEYQDYLYFHGFSVEVTEALAEYWHKEIRKELNIHHKDASDIKKLFQQGYQGSRYSFGYPACPNLEDNKQLFKILKPERIGITMTEEWQMVPEQTTNAIILHHPEAKYFFVR